MGRAEAFVWQNKPWFGGGRVRCRRGIHSRSVGDSFVRGSWLRHALGKVWVVVDKVEHHGDGAERFLPACHADLDYKFEIL